MSAAGVRRLCTARKSRASEESAVMVTAATWDSFYTTGASVTVCIVCKRRVAVWQPAVAASAGSAPGKPRAWNRRTVSKSGQRKNRFSRLLPVLRALPPRFVEGRSPTSLLRFSLPLRRLTHAQRRARGTHVVILQPAAFPAPGRSEQHPHGRRGGGIAVGRWRVCLDEAEEGKWNAGGRHARVEPVGGENARSCRCESSA